MKTIFNTNELKDIVGKIKPFVNGQYLVNEIKNQIFIKGKGGVAIINAIDFDASIRCTIKYTGDDIDMVIPSKQFMLIVNNISSDNITFKPMQGEVVISGGGKKLKLPMVDIVYDDNKEIEDGSIEINFNEDMLLSLKSTITAIPSKGFQQWDSGLSIKKVNDKLMSFCTDGFWMLFHSLGEYDGDIDEFLLLKDSITKILTINANDAKLIVGEKFIFFITNNTELRIVRMNTRIPPFMRVLRELDDVNNITTFNSTELSNELNVLIKLYDSLYMNINCEGNKMKLEGEGFEEILIDCEGDDCPRFTLDPRKLLVFLKRNKGDIKMYMSPDHKNIKFKGDNKKELFILNKMM